MCFSTITIKISLHNLPEIFHWHINKTRWNFFVSCAMPHHREQFSHRYAREYIVDSGSCFRLGIVILVVNLLFKIVSFVFATANHNATNISCSILSLSRPTITQIPSCKIPKSIICKIEVNTAVLKRDIIVINRSTKVITVVKVLTLYPSWFSESSYA